MNVSETQKFIELWTNKKQTGDSPLVQSKDTKTIYINSIWIINDYFNRQPLPTSGIHLVISPCQALVHHYI